MYQRFVCFKFKESTPPDAIDTLLSPTIRQDKQKGISQSNLLRPPSCPILSSIVSLL